MAEQGSIPRGPLGRIVEPLNQFRQTDRVCITPRKLVEIRCFLGIGSEGFPHSVMERGPDFANRLVLAVGPGAVRQQRDSDAGFEVDPE